MKIIYLFNNFIKFIYYFSKSDFVRILAFLPDNFIQKNLIKKYAYFKIGIYSEALNDSIAHKSYYSLLADVVSYSVLHKYDIVNEILSEKRNIKYLNKKRFHILKSILPFYPEKSFELLSKYDPAVVQVALLLHMNKFAEANKLLKMKNVDEDPEMHLLRVNSGILSEMEKIEELNFFLARYELSPVEKIDNGENLNAINLSGKKILKSFSGPLVTVIMTTFRCAKRIEYSLKSLLNQTYQNIEIIVVDDASDDETENLVKKLTEKYMNISYIKLPVNIGTYGAKTIGLKLSKGDYILCHDSDDWAHPQKIEIQMRPLLSDDKLVFTFSNLVRLSDDGIFYSKSIFPMVRMNASSILFRKSLVGINTGYWDLVRSGADSEFYLRLKLVFGKQRFMKINKPLSFCAHRPDSLMNSFKINESLEKKITMRMEYWESFSNWHIETLRSGKMPMMSNDVNEKRQFYCPPDNMTSLEDFLFCKKELGLI